MSRQSKWVFCMVMVLALLGSYPGISNAGGNKETYLSISYNVKPGETLYSIAKKFYLTGDYEQVAKTNGWNPKASLKAGTMLKLSNPLVMDQYAVKQGDTLFAIAGRYFTRSYYMNALMAYNGITDPNTGLKAGAALRIPLPSGELRHIVRKGETLYSLSAAYFKLQDYLEAITEYNAASGASGPLKAGQVLRIPNPYYAFVSTPASPAASTAAAVTPAAAAKLLSIEIDVTRNKLYVRSDGAVVKSFDVASGKQKGLTPTGTYEIVTKIKNPWYSAKSIPGGDPKNPLGSRWLGLNVGSTQGAKYGIHGTNAPASIGKNASAGCIRMLNADVEWLYAAIPTGTTVKIHA